MGFVLLDDKMYDHPLIASLSASAAALWLSSLCWSSRHATAGFIPAEVPRLLGAKPRHVKELTFTHSWAPRRQARQLWVPVDGGWDANYPTLWRFQTAEHEIAARRHQAKVHRATVLARDGHRCLFCGATEDLCLDHIYPVSRGGSSRLENLQTLCRSCNSHKGAKT